VDDAVEEGPTVDDAIEDGAIADGTVVDGDGTVNSAAVGDV